jgi:undecaprenyl diphosphate synthase
MNRIPRHVAIIMDGNGRWAQRRGHPRVYGHVRGSSRVKPIVREADRLGVQALTLYAFSTENWRRPDAELGVLWRLLKKYLAREVDELDRQNVRLNVIGEVERLSPDVREALDTAIARLEGNTGLQLTFAVSYGSRRELARAARLFAEDCARGARKPGEMTDELLGKYLWTSKLGCLAEVDLVIRTSGERRVSNFMLWQAAYAEFYFTDLCWPDFGPAELRAAMADYAERERRFGGLGCAASVAVGDASVLEIMPAPVQLPTGEIAGEII